MKIEMVDIARVSPYPGNPRKNAEAVRKVEASLREFGWRQPIVVDPDYVVVVGHTRLLAAVSLGHALVPVHVAEGLTPAQLRAYRLMDNRSHEEAEWDLGMLAAELRGIQAADLDLALTGFDQDELAELLRAVGEEAPDPDAVPPVPRLARSVPGDVWVAGPHRVSCCDATDVVALQAATGGALADIVWTDPPYNVGYKAKAGTIANDDMADGAFLEFLRSAFAATSTVMKPGAAIYVAHADTEGLNFRRAFREAGLKLSGCLIWRKDALVLGRSDYQWQHEPILYGWKLGGAHRWFGGRKQTTVGELPGGAFAQMPDGRWQISIGDRVLIVSGDATVEEVAPSIINEPRPKRSADHPTMKPTALIERMLRNNTRPGDLVFDPFGGSGSTLIAADRLGLVAVTTELDPLYTDVIVQRWQDYAGRKATRLADGVCFDDVEPRATQRAA